MGKDARLEDRLLFNVIKSESLNTEGAHSKHLVKDSC